MYKTVQCDLMGWCVATIKDILHVISYVLNVPPAMQCFCLTNTVKYATDIIVNCMCAVPEWKALEA